MANEGGGLAPVAGSERIQALDVIRGFALLGIFLMNVEWFNRPIAELDLGLPANLHGADLLAGLGIHLLVRGKFWTMFSLLFGMGFAVMLTRAERAGRDFFLPYLRRIAALGLMGAAHFILLWAGDILFSYALTAILLMMILFARAGAFLLAIATCVAVAAVFQLDAAMGAAISLCLAGVMALYTRDGAELDIGGRRWPLVCLVLWSVGALLMVSGAASRNAGPAIIGALVFASGFVARRLRQPAGRRPLHAGVNLYATAFLGMALVGLSWAAFPQSRAAPSAEQVQQIVEQRAGRAADARMEEQVMAHGRYADAVRYRLGKFPENAGHDAEFAGLAVAMFLIGVWFVRGGVMENIPAHLPLFRRLAFVWLPIGVALGIVGAAVAVTHIPGQNDARFQFSQGMLFLGNLPASLGYVGALVLLLHSRGPGRHVALLAPAGRMALTNYLTQSLVQGLFFYGYGLGHWGMPRAQQALFVFAVYGLQIAFSRWWLARFQYGPMEWLWRAATYWTWPPMRRAASA